MPAESDAITGRIADAVAGAVESIAPLRILAQGQQVLEIILIHRQHVVEFGNIRSPAQHHNKKPRRGGANQRVIRLPLACHRQIALLAETAEVAAIYAATVPCAIAVVVQIPGAVAEHADFGSVAC